MKYLRSATFGWDNIKIRKSEFVAKTQFLCEIYEKPGHQNIYDYFYSNFLRKRGTKLVELSSQYMHTFFINIVSERSWVFLSNSNFLIPISLQTDSVNLSYSKFRPCNLTEFIFLNIKGLRASGFKDKGIRKPEFVAKTLFRRSFNNCSCALTSPW